MIARLSPAALALILAACSTGESHGTEKPARVDPVAHESELMKITLAPAAEKRLGIAVARIAPGEGTGALVSYGEVVVPPLSSGGLPIGSTTDLAMLSANQARADGDVQRAQAQAGLAQVNLRRAETLMREEAGSAKARDDAAAAVAVGQADLRAAQAQRALFGTPVGALGRQGTFWVRVIVLAADRPRIVPDASAAIIILGQKGTPMPGRPVQGPPSANAAAGSVDLYFAVANRGLQMGQRVAVRLATTQSQAGRLAIPASAILHDVHGGEWVYVRTGQHAYERRRVQVAAIAGDTALLATGPPANDAIVTAGAAELFGTEFGAK